MDFTLLHIVALSLVVIYAFDRFDSPSNKQDHSQLSWKKYSTTSTKYYTGLVLYIVVYILFYYILIVVGKEPLAKVIDPSLQKLPIELFSALILTVLLPSIRGIKEFDGFIKGKIYSLVNIPSEVKYMAKRIESAELVITNHEQDNIVKAFTENGMNKDSLNKLLDDNIIDKVMKAEFLIRQLARCLTEKSYKDFSMHYSANFKRLRESHDDVLLLVETYVNSSAAIRQDKSILKKLNKDTDKTLEDIYNLIGMAVISRVTTDKGRIARLSEIGIQINSEDRRFSWDMVAMIFMGIFILYFLKYTFETRVSDSKSNLTLSAQIALAYCLAVFWAVYPKTKKWEVAKQVSSSRNYSYYLLASVLTFVSYGVIRFLAGLSGAEDVSEYFSGAFLTYMPYQIPSTMTALFLCFMLESKITSKVRYFDLVLGSIALPTFMFVAKFIISSNTGKAFNFDNNDIIVSALAGMLIYYNVPYWYSRAQSSGPVADTSVTSVAAET
ncbi:MAG: hypothetical protein OEY29_03980 [Gammaproteobacteria bacterium]|nr:hypothetical protein [Gammaproteobacteria bacterium]